ncbi:MAG: phosphate signaling complex protein PhoU [Planctomycetales bacterium]|nr:phosphate signaling complex protein PhoU [Planctomycetales bacterium]
MDTRITELEERILRLGELSEAAVSRAITALMRSDTMMARAIIKEDAAIDHAEIEVEEVCLDVLEHERPCGSDLRFVVAVLKINDNLERIGDLAENVAEVVVQVGDWDRFRRVPGIEELATQAQTMVRNSMMALVNRDAILARRVIQDDKHADMLYERIKTRIEKELDRIPENANPLLKLEHATRQFERIGDVATNIAEEVIYLVEGQIVRHHS